MEWTALGMVVLLLGLMAGIAFAVRRYAGLVGVGGSADLHVVSARRLDLNTTLYVIVVDGRRLLIGSGRDGARLVADLTDKSTPPPG